MAKDQNFAVISVADLGNEGIRRPLQGHIGTVDLPCHLLVHLHYGFLEALCSHHPGLYGLGDLDGLWASLCFKDCARRKIDQSHTRSNGTRNAFGILDQHLGLFLPLCFCRMELQRSPAWHGPRTMPNLLSAQWTEWCCCMMNMGSEEINSPPNQPT